MRWYGCKYVMGFPHLAPGTPTQLVAEDGELLIGHANLSGRGVDFRVPASSVSRIQTIDRSGVALGRSVAGAALGGALLGPVGAAVGGVAAGKSPLLLVSFEYGGVHYDAVFDGFNLTSTAAGLYHDLIAQPVQRVDFEALKANWQIRKHEADRRVADYFAPALDRAFIDSGTDRAYASWAASLTRTDWASFVDSVLWAIVSAVESEGSIPAHQEAVTQLRNEGPLSAGDEVSMFDRQVGPLGAAMNEHVRDQLLERYPQASDLSEFQFILKLMGSTYWGMKELLSDFSTYEQVRRRANPTPAERAEDDRRARAEQRMEVLGLVVSVASLLTMCWLLASCVF